MKRQKQIVSVNENEITNLIGYDGNIIEDYYINKTNCEIYKKEDNTFILVIPYLNTCKFWKYGYYKVRINNKYMNLHWLIGRVLVPGYSVGKVLQFKNGISNDIRLENLEWTSKSDNIKKYWDNLTEEERENHREAYINGLKRGHEAGHYTNHLKSIHENKRKK